MKYYVLVLITLCVAGKGFTQCYKDPRDLNSTTSHSYKGEIDTLVKTTYRLDEQGNKTMISQVAYSPIVGGLLGSYVEVDVSYGQRRTELVYTYNEDGKVLTATHTNLDYGAITGKDTYYYNARGCDSLSQHEYINIYSGEGSQTYWKKVESDKNTRTEICFNDKGTSSKVIYTYNKKGQIEKKVEYISHEDDLQPDDEPWLTTRFYYDKAGNMVKLEHLNNDGKVAEVYVYVYDEHGNMTNEAGSVIEGEENPLDFANKLLDSIGENEKSMINAYQYDKEGNIIEAKWKYGSNSYFAHMFEIRYVYKK